MSSSNFFVGFLVCVGVLLHTIDAQQPSCCFKNGLGSAVLYGGALIDIGNGNGAQFYASSLIAFDPITPALSVLVNSSDPNQAPAGWIITQNSTSQILTVWSGSSCTTQAIPLPEKFVNGFSLCPGKPDSFLPKFASNYTTGTLSVNIFSFSENPTSGEAGFFLDGSEGCGLVIVYATNPLGKNVFSFQPFYGVPDQPLPQWITPPKICS